MNAWPLLHRELLVGARKKSTRWLRVGVAAGAFLLGAMFIVSFSRVGGMPAGAIGTVVFQILVSIAFAVSGLFGVFFAADAISSERREGTLGLLFLTRLRGLDVVLGKLASTTLRSAYALMAGLPVMALPLLLGGVTFKAYAYAAVVLGNTLFLSVSAGLLVSSFNRKPVRAVMGTLLLVLGIAGIPPMADTIWAGFDERQWTPLVSYLSPAYSLSQSLAGAPGNFLWGVVVQHFVGWLFLTVASRRTSRITEKFRQTSKVKAVRWMVSANETKAARKLRDRSPIQWLISHRSRGPTIVAMIVVVITGVGFALSQPDGKGPWQTQVVATGLTAILFLLSFVLLIWLTVDATRHTGDARKSNAFELLLSTPLTIAEIVSGIVRGIWRIFGVAILTVLLLQMATAWLSISALHENVSSGASSGSGFNNSDFLTYQIISAVFRGVNLLATCHALIWVGMWLGLRSEQTTAAAAMTFVFVVVVPGIILALGVGLLFGVGMAVAGLSIMWLNALIQGVAALLVKIGFIVWARRQLLAHFREAANGTLSRRGRKKERSIPGGPPPLPSA